MLKLDHIAVSGATRVQARQAVEAALGLPLQPGGAHAVFHTHNALLGLRQGLYLEAIAINPAAPKPARPRWFDLDRFEGPPRLTNWICAVPDLDAALACFDLDFGAPVDLARGDLRWRMAVPSSGVLPFDNCAPALIEWREGAHPATRLADQAVTLTELCVSHPRADALRARLAPYLDAPCLIFEDGPPGLSARFETPHGPRILSG